MKRRQGDGPGTDRGLALLDWDGTLRPGIMLLDWIAFLGERGTVATDVVVSLHGLASSYRAGEIPYAEFVVTVMNGYARGLEGVSTASISEAAARFVEVDGAHLFPVARPLLSWLESANLETALISGAPAEPLSAHAARLGVEGVFASTLAVEAGRYLGTVVENMAEAATKTAAVRSLQLARRLAFAAGDREADAEMVTAAGVGAFVGAPGLALPPSFPRTTVRLDPAASADEVAGTLDALHDLVARPWS